MFVLCSLHYSLDFGDDPKSIDIFAMVSGEGERVALGKNLKVCNEQSRWQCSGACVWRWNCVRVAAYRCNCKVYMQLIKTLTAQHPHCICVIGWVGQAGAHLLLLHCCALYVGPRQR
jgi:hypothetical protein